MGVRRSRGSLGGQAVLGVTRGSGGRSIVSHGGQVVQGVTWGSSGPRAHLGVRLSKGLLGISRSRGSLGVRRTRGSLGGQLVLCLGS